MIYSLRFFLSPRRPANIDRLSAAAAVRSMTSSSSQARRMVGKNKQQSKKDFEYCVDLVQNRDRETYISGLLMPASSRHAYFAIRAFNVELASIKDGSVSRKVGGAQFEESGASMALKLRIKWWRDALGQIYGDNEGIAPPDDQFMASMTSSVWNNPVTRVLNEAVHEKQLTRRFLERLLEARESDLDIRQLETFDEALDYSESIFSSLFYLSLETADVREEASDVVAYHAGIGVGLTTTIRGSLIRLAHGECSIPKELLPDFPYHKFNEGNPNELLTDGEKQVLSEAVKFMAYEANKHFSTARDLQSDVPRHARPVFLPVIPSMHHLSKLEKGGYNIFDPKLMEADRLTILALLSRTWLTGIF
jgi:NADH dehydrogenase [ubiquinone] 1 alpha subcomplex assembly factor 6